MDAVVVCVDRYLPELGLDGRDTYHAQAFLTLTEPLAAAQWTQVFPESPLLVWDSDLVYHYVRRTGDGRLLVGGGRLRDTYSANESPSDGAFESLERYAKERFASLRDARFTHRWQGLLGLSKDLLPIAGRIPRTRSQFVAGCSAGLPWSVLAGETAAAQALGGTTELDAFFDPDRRFNGIERLQPVLGKPLTWALSYYLAKR